MSIYESASESEFRRKVRGFSKAQIAPVAEKVEGGHSPLELVRLLGDQGFLGAPFAKKDGGLGLGWSFETIVAEEVSAVSAATEMVRLASGTLYSAPLAYFGNASQKRVFLKPVLAGDKIGALALTEPTAGSDAGSIKTYAAKRGNDFVVNGEKRFITNVELRITSLSLQLQTAKKRQSPESARL